MTVFLSAFLLFQVQPLIGKAILPWFGGSAATWICCLLFFQVALLGGYLYAHLLVERLAPRTQGLVHLAVLAASLLLLPIVPSPEWKPADASDPTWRILVLLLASVGGPFFVLSTTGPLIQAWSARARPGSSPYRLYALSNAGSLLALVSYPFVFEPALSLGAQTSAWAWGYGAFAVLCGAWAVRVARAGGAVEVRTRAPADAVTTALWILLAACGSAVLLATTNRITQDVAPVPFLWVLPLALYLLSFVLCFGERGAYRRGVVGWALVLSLFAIAGFEAAEVELPLPLGIAVHAFALFACCMACHGELAASKPDPSRLTAYYVSISVGGALGGALVALVAPAVFDTLLEFPVALGACCIAWAIARRRESLRLRPARAVFVGLGALALLGAAVPAWKGYLVSRNVVEASRNFYGTLQVREEDGRRSLYHGQVTHGIQLLSPELRGRGTAYYGDGSGVEIALRAARPRRVGAVGMGAGVIAAYARPGDEYVFYELDPDVADLARSRFTFLADAEARGARVRVELGDGRLALERESPEPFDLLVVDAFSGDSIPVHLLTTECFELYRRRLASYGLLCVHVSNLYLELSAVVRVGVESLGWPAVRLVAEADPARALLANDWVVASPEPARIGELPASTIRPWPEVGSLRPWTDDRSSLFPLLK